MKKLIKKIKLGFWWLFKATEEGKMIHDQFNFGTSFMKDRKRIDLREFYINNK